MGAIVTTRADAVHVWPPSPAALGHAVEDDAGNLPITSSRTSGQLSPRLSGVGAFPEAMRHLNELGLSEVVRLRADVVTTSSSELTTLMPQAVRRAPANDDF